MKSVYKIGGMPLRPIYPVNGTIALTARRSAGTCARNKTMRFRQWWARIFALACRSKGHVGVGGTARSSSDHVDVEEKPEVRKVENTTQTLWGLQT